MNRWRMIHSCPRDRSRSKGCAEKLCLKSIHNDKFLKMEKVAVDRDLVLSYEQDDIQKTLKS